MSVLWQPSTERIEHSTLTAFQRWLQDERGLSFADYASLWGWSTDALEKFWGCVWDYFGLGARGASVLERRVMPGARWFQGTFLNYAERALAHDPGRIAIEYEREDGAHRTITFGERLSPRHVPDRILAVPAIPYTVTGKKCEVPVKRLLRGEPADLVIARESLRHVPSPSFRGLHALPLMFRKA